MTPTSSDDLRVLFVMNLFPPAYTGGAEVINYHTCRGLRCEGIDCSILVVNNRLAECVDEWYEYDGIPVHRVGFYTRWRRAVTDVFDWRVYRSVLAELRQQRPHLVHIHNVSGATLAPFVACRRARVPVVNTLHDFWLLCPNNMLYRRDGSLCSPAEYPKGCKDCFRRYDYWGNIAARRAVFARLTSNVKLFLSPSQALTWLHIEAGYTPNRFRLVRHGLEHEESAGTEHPGIQEVIASANHHRTIVFAGGGIEIKGAKVLLEALPFILRYVDHVRVIVAGTGEAQILAQFRGYAPAVRVLGQVPAHEMRHLLAIADLVVVPSTCAESFSLVTLESLQVGTPVVGSDLGGIPELIDEGETGYLFPSGDHVALAERVILHFARPALARRQMRRRSVQRVQEKLAFQDHIQGVMQAYREVMGL
jgi:glycosyltransferase involved in cell wall biosynthesis